MLIEKASATAAFAGSGTAVIFGLTPSEWSVVGVIGGLVVAVAGLVINVVYRHMHYRLAVKKATAWSPLGDGE